ncbi:uncharacterized protein F5Z01DRAFT_655485 [Emericellopsis atlantica]|uniref:MAPEG family protein n=1 Tax=Emericellopsis atlantica TaxID=2614577 RepID=A0A9P8CP65_9HYPO|nr:uncharacterized protein F5Z01DRAFT_655485 [Emericellopsis atlantica]KAG9254519.1 hypothetical protein F5Z01DRAFT_655485 [Emericellopsis atlantica]
MALGVRTYPIMSKPGLKLLDRNKPRDFVEVLKKADLDENVRGRLLRAEGCAANWLEALPVFAAAVTAGNSAGVSPLIMNCLSIGWLISRLLYTYVYVIWQANEVLGPNEAPTRFKVWAVGATLAMSMFILAGRQA